MCTATAPPQQPLEVETPKGFKPDDGRLVGKDMNVEAVRVASRLLKRLGRCGEETGYGAALSAEAAYRCMPDRPRHPREPDVSSVRAERMKELKSGKGGSPIPTDRAAEIISSNGQSERTAAEVPDQQTVAEPPTRVIDPETWIAHVYTPEPERLLR
jgi:hypothetical protein